MRIALATLCLNEMEWLPKLIAQHRDWPGLAGWVFVEAADRVYAAANPGDVTTDGLSTDGTTGFLSDVARLVPKVSHLRFGFTGGSDPSQGKIEARNAYCRALDEIDPDWLIVLDADEFYALQHQANITRMLSDLAEIPVLLNQRHVWRPPSISARPLFKLEAVRGYWGVPHLRIWPWRRGSRYVDNHNYLMGPRGEDLRSKMMRLMSAPIAECVHLGFASSARTRRSKHRYYVARGEGAGDGRQKYVECREAWETWTPGAKLPHRANVIPYEGPVPEAFL